MEWLAAIFMGLSRRFYGSDKGGFPFPFNRVLAYAIPTSACMAFIFDLWAYQYSWGYFFILVFANWLSMSLADYDKYWGVKSLRDWQMMALNGVAVLFVPALFFFAFMNFDFQVLKAFMVAAMMLPVGYFIARFIPDLGKHFNRGPEIGEFLSHFLMGAVLMLFIK